MLLGLALLFVGAVLFLNGLWLTGRIGDREIAVINIFVGGLTLVVALYSAFGPGADAGSIKGAALTLLFTFTYLWVAYNRFNDVDGRGLGWFSLFVSITVIPVAFDTLIRPSRPGTSGSACAGPPGRCCGSCSSCCWPRPADRQGDRPCHLAAGGADRLAARIPAARRCHGTGRRRLRPRC